jgi:hypothetical protein
VALILHLGDFGIWPGVSGRVYIDQLEDACAEHSGRPLPVSEHIAILPQGHRFTLEGRSFVSLGGAPSIHLEYRSRNHDWWVEEAIAPADVATIVEGGYADVMLAHDARSRRTRSRRWPGSGARPAAGPNMPWPTRAPAQS